MVSDVDSCGERLPLKGLRKVTILCVFSLLPLREMADVKKKKKKQLVWLVWKDCQMSSSYQTADMFSFKKIPAEGKSLTFQRVSGSPSSHHVQHCTQAKTLLFTRLTLSPSDSNLQLLTQVFYSRNRWNCKNTGNCLPKKKGVTSRKMWEQKMK